MILHGNDALFTDSGMMILVMISRLFQSFALISAPNTYRTDVKVFSLKSNTWRTVEAFPFGGVPSLPYGPLNYPGHFVNGSLH